ncbi:tetratricopeptide repeat protein [Cryptosporangium phraense]|uniref:Tetratricopeptide repeat protein n=1 Tax=Cryptosporangium phraense TaxID=2593070 RepID=A0A545AXZ7_9ACTN|nr:tetratricopeptide repeat protein [Cryptosporangium phraense]TQS46151.1 tetratricopeptide repeat protein [Cryptosporangium phraense]
MGFEDAVRGAFRRGDTDAVVGMAKAEVVRAREAGDAAGEVEALYALSRVALRGGELVRAEELAREALSVAVGAAGLVGREAGGGGGGGREAGGGGREAGGGGREAGGRGLEERPRHVLAAVARLSGNYELARERYLASIALNEELGRPEAVNSESYNLAFTELRLGNRDRARELFAEVRERVFREGYDSFVPYLGVAASALAAADGDDELAARMIGLTDAAYAEIGQVPDPDDAQELSAAREKAIMALGEAAFGREYEAGRALTPRDAL